MKRIKSNKITITVIIFKLSRVTQVWWVKHLKNMLIKDLRNIRECNIMNKKIIT